MLIRRVGNLILLAGLALTASAETACPWLTRGSATKLLGGSASVEANSVADVSGTCHFSYQDGAVSRILDIYVQVRVPFECPQTAESITGIGTVARECVIEHSSLRFSDKVEGQVRDRTFAILLTLRGAKLSGPQQDALRNSIRETAEQVAGNLF